MKHIEWANGRRIVTEQIPPPVSRFQARMALRRANLFHRAQTACTLAGGDTLIAWNEAIEWRRDSALVAKVASDLGLSDAQIDALFLAAAKVAV
jgi:hypothetical protein